jgi:hypothetical protein
MHLDFHFCRRFSRGNRLDLSDSGTGLSQSPANVTAIGDNSRRTKYNESSLSQVWKKAATWRLLGGCSLSTSLGRSQNVSRRARVLLQMSLSSSRSLVLTLLTADSQTPENR